MRARQFGAKVEVMGGSLYGGVPGMLLFYSYLAAATGEAKFDEPVQAMERQVANFVRRSCRPGRAAALRGSVGRTGGYEGLTSAIYALLHSIALRGGSVDSITESLLVALEPFPDLDHQLDWIGGAAGVTAVLLAVHKKTGHPEALELARRCGGRLVASGRQAGRGLGWVTVGDLPLTGLGHGASGIALALHRLRDATASDFYSPSIEGALQFERAHYCSRVGNWRDLRSWVGDGRGFAHGWCAGAAGIGLARVGMSTRSGGRFAHEIGVACKTSLTNLAGHQGDGLCHGTFGNVELLFAASKEDPALHNLALESLQAILRSRRRDGFRFPWGGETFSLMLGLGGIGYTLLRIASGGVVPSVLLLEPATEAAAIHSATLTAKRTDTGQCSVMV